jgi:hypothetical protein
VLVRYFIGNTMYWLNYEGTSTVSNTPELYIDGTTFYCAYNDGSPSPAKATVMKYNP